MKRAVATAVFALAAALPPAMAHAQNSATAVSVPLMLPASDAVRQSFVRLINESDEAGAARIVAVDDGGNAADPIEVRLAANSVLHFNSGDLTNGNASKGIDDGIGSPREGSWRLRVETALSQVRVLSFIRTRVGFLTAMQGVLPRDAQGRLLARTINPASNRNQRSSLRLVNTGASAERVSIAGVDDAGSRAGPVTLTLAAGQSRTLSAVELEEGAPGMEGTLGDGAGKWRLLVTASQAVMGMALLETSGGHITNLSTPGVLAAEGDGTSGGAGGVSVPLMLPASDAVRQSFVRLINESDEAGAAHIVAVDDGGNAAGPITIRLAADSVLHFNSGDLTDGNASKGIDDGIGVPREGSWRLRVETALSQVRVLSFIRTRDGFLTAMQGVLPRDAQGRLLARTINPASNPRQRSSLRLVNTGASAERVSIAGVDDAGSRAGPMTLTLAAGRSRTLSAVELEEGARGIEGMLGDGAGKWQLLVTASQAVMGMALLETSGGHITNLSTAGVMAAEGLGTSSGPVVVTVMPNRSLASGEDATSDLSVHFSDDQALVYEASSSDAEVVRVSVTGIALTLMPVAEGSATVTVTARDPDGNSVSQTFSVTVRSSQGLGIGERFRDCDACPEMVVVPTGTFMMGAPVSEVGSEDRERPVHAVSVPSFAAGVYEVTFAEWDACVADGGCGGYRPHDGPLHEEGSGRWGRGNRPVINVSWHDAKRYVEWLSGRTGESYRLLSESEWEYAARAGTSTAYNWGNEVGVNRANCWGCGSRWDDERTAPVGSFDANAWGLHDVHGNVWEWTEDCWNESYAGAPSDGSAWLTGNCGSRVWRSGSWNDHPSGHSSDLRAATRVGVPTDLDIADYGDITGFRVARALR